jgi:peptide/nickel transport system substrate-binding protein
LINNPSPQSLPGISGIGISKQHSPGSGIEDKDAGSPLIWAALFLICFSLFFSGCSLKDAPSRARPTPDSIIRIGTTMNVKGINLLSDYYYNLLARIMTHESLIRFDEHMNPIPCLATHFECSNDGKVWTFMLSSEARWQDGRPVTAEDVAFTFRYIAEQNLDSRWISDSIESIDASAHKVVFHLKKPNSRFHFNGGFIVHILPRHIWQNIKDARIAEDSRISVGSGPFILDAFDKPSGLLSFRTNGNYHGGAPRMSKAEFHIFGNLDVLALALEKGEADVFFNYAASFPAPYVESLKQSRKLRFIESDSAGIPALLGFNPRRELTGSLRFRRALALAIDYEQINLAIMGGKGAIPGPGIVPLPYPFRESYAPWQQDLEESRRLLKEEGLSDINGDGFLDNREGKKVILQLLARTDLWGDNQIARLIAHDLAGLGIEVNIQSVDLSTWQTFNRQGNYDLLLFRTTAWGMTMHAGYASGYFDSRTEGSAVCPVIDSSFSSLCDQILCETRPKEQEVLYRKIQRYYRDHLPAVALCWGKGIYPYSQEWDGFRLNFLEGGLINSIAWKDIHRRNPIRE